MAKTEATIGRALSPYAASKRIGEIIASTSQLVTGQQSIGLRYFNVFGPRQDPAGPYAAVIPRWIELLVRGEPCVVFGDPEKSRDFCFVDNVVRCNLLAALAPAEALPQVVNVACGKRTTLAALFEAIRERVAQYRPDAAHAVLRQAAGRTGDIEHSLANIELARSALGYEPSVDLGHGLDQTVGWFIRSRMRTTPSGSYIAAAQPQPFEGAQ